MTRILLIFLVIANGLIVPAFAATNISPDTLNPLKKTGTAEVLKVIDPQTILLHDGRTILLSSIYFPDLKVHSVGDFSLLAKKLLENFLLGKTVVIYQTPEEDWGRTNRMGHHIAHLQRQDDKIWAQGLLLSLGLAQVLTTERTPELSATMYEFEKEARDEGIGLWATDNFKVLSPVEAENKLDSFQIVEGRVISAAIKSNRVFLNFGRDWKSDFTLSIASEDRKNFNKQGINPLDWRNKTLRVRGWLRDYNGAFMEVTHPQAVEVLE